MTRDYGAVPLVKAEVSQPPETETALSLLESETDIETRFGGGFVNSIDGVEGSAIEDGRSFDWFFFVNGIESGIGSAEYEIAGGDRVWWDYRDWTDAMRVPAVVGSWPEPFLQASSANPDEAPVQCAGAAEPCAAVREALDEAGAIAVDAEPGPAETARMLVGTWDEIKDDPVADLLTKEPSESGLFARFEEGSPDELLALDVEGREAARLGSGAGLVAAVRDGEDAPTWLVTGVDQAGVQAAAAALGEVDLRDRYAVAVGAGSDATLPLPVQEDG